MDDPRPRLPESDAVLRGDARQEIVDFPVVAERLSEIRLRAEALAARIRETVGAAADVDVVDEIARAGGGSLPLAEIPTAAVALSPRVMGASELEAQLRLGNPGIIARVREDRVLLDPRTLLSPEEDAVVARLGEILGG